MTRFCINLCLLAVISLFSGVIWQGAAYAAMPVIQPLGSIADGLQGPSRVEVDAAGNLYVANTGGMIVKFDKYGTRVASFSTVAISGLGLAVTADGSVIYASAGDKVVILDAAGKLQGYLGSGAGEFQNAGVIELGVNGEVIVADSRTRQVKVFMATGGAPVLLGGGFGGVTGLAVDSKTGDIYVADPVFEGARTPQLYVYHSDYTLKSQLDAASAFGSRLQLFGGLTIDDQGRLLYVADAESGNIRVVELPSVLQGTFNGLSQKIIRPDSIAYDVLTKRLFVVWAGIRVDVYGVSGGVTPVKVNAVPSIPKAITVGEVSSQTPSLLFDNAIDADGDLLSYNVRVLDAAGTEVAGFGVAGGAGPTSANVVQPLVENASYSWQVQADDGQATSAWSAPNPIYVNAVQEAPAAPKLLSFVNGESAGSDAVLTWGAAADADPFASVSYRVEIYSGASLVAGSAVSTTNSTILGYADLLNPGATYTWQVVAVDNTGLETVSSNSGRFVFQASVLTITSSANGAKVYLGGHHGYAGRYLGLAPVSIRGLAAADYAVVVEAAGFEPFVATVTLAKDAQVEVFAGLDAASLADSFAIRDLNLTGQAVSGVDIAPIIVDLDRDGILDLLLANNGYINFYKGSLAVDPLAVDSVEYPAVVLPGAAAPAADKLVFNTAAQRLAIPQIVGASPSLVDWNNDDLLDLLIGGSDGSVKLFLGQGGLNFAVTGDWLVTVATAATPAVGDFDGDGDKDLIVSSDSELLLFENVGTDASPVLNAQTVIAALTAPAAPLFMDWDADGSRELLLLVQGELLHAVVVNGLVATLETTGLNVANAETVFAVNFAGRHYNDLVFGTTAGALVVANGQQGTLSPAYIQAMLTKLADLKLLILDQAPGLVAKADSIAVLIGQGDYAAASTLAVQFVGDLDYATNAWSVAVEFAGMLDSDAAALASQAAADKAAADKAAADKAAAELSGDGNDHGDHGAAGINDDGDDDKLNKISKKNKKNKKDKKH